LLSLAAAFRGRRRSLELPHLYVIAASVALVSALALGTVAALAPLETATRVRLTAAEVAALFGWLTLAIVGYAHRIVPFLHWRAQRERGGPRQPPGAPLLAARLYSRSIAYTAAGVCAIAVVTLVVGVAAGSVTALRVAGWCFAAVAVAIAVDFTVTPRQVAATAPVADPAGPVPVTLRPRSS
jgi:hypothetical protein